LIQPKSNRLTHLLTAIPAARARWGTDDVADANAHALDKALLDVCGDLVQAIQALKESLTTSSPDDETRNLLLNLLDALGLCQSYCIEEGLEFPFTRAQNQVEDFLDMSAPTPSQSHVFDQPLLECELQTSSLINHAKSMPLKIDINVDSFTPLVPHEMISINPNPHQMSQIAYTDLGFQADSCTSNTTALLRLPKLLNGLWQMSSPAWGSASSKKQQRAFVELTEAGLVATDMADHYVSLMLNSVCSS
jgi:hypothetical protein